MPRPITPAQLAAITSSAIQPALFVKVQFLSATAYMWSGIGSYVWDGVTWLGMGSLGTIGTIEEGTTVEAKGVVLTLSGLDPALLDGITDECQVGLPVIVYLGLFNGDILIDSPIVAWSGRTDQPTLDVDGLTATIQINCENRLVEMNVAVDRRYTNEDQQLDYPGDTGMSFINSIQDVTIFWGHTAASVNNL
ncbi:MAG TPA: hypothetical protein VGP83_16905 [Pyrinomonadaceae bacterium]|jgi:hypothetical protein|nr:hypothetical protein [Pyrinomonadaceae bacterium]